MRQPLGVNLWAVPDGKRGVITLLQMCDSPNRELRHEVKWASTSHEIDHSVPGGFFASKMARVTRWAWARGRYCK